MENNEIKIVKNQDIILNDIDKAIDRVLSGKIVQINDVIRLINEFQINSQLLDKALPKFIGKLSISYLDSLADDPSLLNPICQIIYNFCKIRGLSLISTLLSTDIELFNTIINRLTDLLSLGSNSTHWYEISFLLLWLSVLILSPFKLDALLGNSDLIQNICFDQLLLQNSSVSYLNDVNILLYSKFLSRNDSTKYLKNYYTFLQANASGLSSNQTIVHLSILLKILKLVNYENHSDLLKIHYLIVSQKFDQVSSKEFPIISKLIIKNFGHLTTKFINSEEEIENVEVIISNLLSIINSKDTIVRYSNGKNIAKIAAFLPEEFQIEILNSVLSQVGIDAIDDFMENPEEVDINQHITVNIDMVSMNQIHGVFVVIAEFLKRGIIRQHLKVVYLLLREFFYFQKPQINSVLTGSNIRDAALYVVWNFIKYNGDLVKEYKEILVSIFKNLIFMVCFDDDLIIRRSTSALLQEIIGRYGSLIWNELGIDKTIAHEYSVKFVELLEFNKLNDVDACFLENSTTVFQKIPSMQDDFFQYLLSSQTSIIGDNGPIIKSMGISKGVYSLHKESGKLSSILLGKLFKLKGKEYSARVLECMKYLLDRQETQSVLFAVAELLTIIDLTDDKSSVELIQKRLMSMSYDFHRDSVFKGEEILHLLTVSLKYYDHIPKYILSDLVFNIIRQNDDKISETFKSFLLRLSKHEKLLLSTAGDEKFFNDKFLYYIRNGNLISSRSVGYININFLIKHNYLEQILKLVLDKSKSFDIRMNLIFSIGQMLPNDHFSEKFVNSVIDQMFDYTLSEQGDVGNKIRYETLKVVENNLDYFRRYGIAVELKLLRLISEIIDRIKYKALILLIQLKFPNDSELLKKAHEVIEGNDYYQYYNFVLGFYYDNYLNQETRERSQEFLKGICLTIGSISGSNLSVYRSLNSFIEFFDKTLITSDLGNLKLRNNLISDLLFLLRNDNNSKKLLDFNLQKQVSFDQDEKIKNCCLNILGKLIDCEIDLVANVPEFKEADQLTIKKLFARIYNIEIKNKSISNFNNIIKIYKYLATKNLARPEAMKRFDVMLKKFINREQLLVKVLQALYTIYKDDGDNAHEEIVQYLEDTQYQSIAHDLKMKKVKLI
ncbi:Cin1 protein [Saccharomycopsis crataegensis]|uniref:Cin1 protein n=1 Tax=Saccharomycopsis crataegensis TaxID=43959 RepID=A0AAV5QV46_9ASCO|nr:Cin1 protein [Saccharomycopsis crataegensis]